MKKARFFILLFTSLLCASFAFGSYTPNPVILVVGRKNVSSDWNQIRAYLDQAPGLTVAAYDISNSETTCVDKWGKEIGDRDYCRGNPNCPLGMTWMEKAQQDMGPFAKAILVGFSTGGPAAREYVSQEYYMNDVDKIISIDSPHMGAPTEIFADLIDAGNANTFLNMGVTMILFGVGLWIPGVTYNPGLGTYLMANGLGAIGFHFVITEIIDPNFEGNPRTCLMQQLDINSDFIRGIARRKYPEDVSFHFIAVTGNHMTAGIHAAQAVMGLVGEFELLDLFDWLIAAPLIVEFRANIKSGDSVFTAANQRGTGDSAYGIPLGFTFTSEDLNLGDDASHNLSDDAEEKAAAILRALEMEGPVLSDTHLTFPPYGWLSGINSDQHRVLTEGNVSDYLPRSVTVKAETESGNYSLTGLDMSTVTTNPGGRTGNAWFNQYLDLPHGGSHAVKVSAINAGQLRAELNTVVYSNGTHFPKQGDVIEGLSSFKWEARKDGRVEYDYSLLSFGNTKPGEVPYLPILLDSEMEGAELRAYNTDGSVNDDVYFYNPATSQEITQVPAGGSFEARLRSLYEGRRFVEVQGNAESKGLEEWRLEYEGPAGQPGYGTFFDAGHTIRVSTTPIVGPIFRNIASWDVGKERLTGLYSIRTLLKDDYLPTLMGHFAADGSKRYTLGPFASVTDVDSFLSQYSDPKGKEVDRATFHVGKPINSESFTMIWDPYEKVLVEFEPGDLLTTNTTYANVFPVRSPPQIPLLDSGMHQIGPKFEIYASPTTTPQSRLGPADFRTNRTAKVRIRLTEDELQAFSAPSQFIYDNLGIYCEDPATGQRTLMETNIIEDAYEINTTVNDLRGNILILPSNSAPQITAIAASPLVFAPERPEMKRPETDIAISVRTASSPRVFVSAEVVTTKESAENAVSQWYLFGFGLARLVAGHRMETA